MGRLFVQIVTGPENPTRVALGLLIARHARDAGHDVDVFFGGDAVSLLRPELLDVANGVGTGSIREHVDALVAGGATLHASAMSSRPRGISPETLGGLPVRMVTPAIVGELIFAADRVIVY